MGSLLVNEWLKLAKKKSTIFLFLFLIVATFGITYLMKLAQASVDGPQSFAELSGVSSFLNLVIVILAASTVAEEFSKGTIKFLLIRPFTRSQILFSKWLVCMAYGLVGTIILGISSFFASIIFLKQSSYTASMTSFGGWNAIEVALLYGATNLLMLVFYVSITLFISAVIRSQALAVGLGIGVLFGSSMMNALLFIIMAKHSWLRWNPFNLLNIRELILDFIQMLGGTKSWTSASDMYLLTYWQMGIGILVISAIIYFITNWLFTKRDVALN